MKLLRNARATFELDEFLARPLMAHLSTESPGGARESPLWYLWEDQAIWLIVEEGYNTFHQRILQEPRVAVGVVDFDPTVGRLQHVGMRGRGSLAAWDDARAARLHRRYYRVLNRYVDHPPTPGEKVTGRLPMVFVRVDPETVVLREQSYGKAVLADQAGERSARSISR